MKLVIDVPFVPGVQVFCVEWDAPNGEWMIVSCRYTLAMYERGKVCYGTKAEAESALREKESKRLGND